MLASRMYARISYGFSSKKASKVPWRLLVANFNLSLVTIISLGGVCNLGTFSYNYSLYFAGNFAHLIRFSLSVLVLAISSLYLTILVLKEHDSRLWEAAILVLLTAEYSTHSFLG